MDLVQKKFAEFVKRALKIRALYLCTCLPDSIKKYKKGCSEISKTFVLMNLVQNWKKNTELIKRKVFVGWHFLAHTSTHHSIPQHTTAYHSILQHTTAYHSIPIQITQHTYKNFIIHFETNLYFQKTLASA